MMSLIVSAWAREPVTRKVKGSSCLRLDMNSGHSSGVMMFCSYVKRQCI